MLVDQVWQNQLRQVSKLVEKRYLLSWCSIHCNIVESTRFKAKWQNRINGEQFVGRGPSPHVFDKRNKLRQILRETNKMENDLNCDEMPLPSFQPSKAKRQQLKSLECKTSQNTLKKTRAMKNKTCIVELSNRQSEIQVKIKQSHTHWSVEIKNEIICDCTQQRTEARKICHHPVWAFLYLLSENDQLLAQTDIGFFSFKRLLNLMLVGIPDALKIICDGWKKYNQKRRDYEKCNLPQI